jgi:hypothetical protein
LADTRRHYEKRCLILAKNIGNDRLLRTLTRVF